MSTYSPAEADAGRRTMTDFANGIYRKMFETHYALVNTANWDLPVHVGCRKAMGSGGGYSFEYVTYGYLIIIVEEEEVYTTLSRLVGLGWESTSKSDPGVWLSLAPVGVDAVLILHAVTFPVFLSA